MIELDGIPVGDNHTPYIIAECGNNHGGDVEVGKRIFDLAKLAGVSAVKLQRRDNKSLFTEAFYNSPYNSEHALAPTYGAHRDRVELSDGSFEELRDYAKKLGLTFFATPFDIPSVDFLERVGVPFYKIASGSVTNTYFLQYVASKNKPIIMSVGGASIMDIHRALAHIPNNVPLVLMHCTAMYPTPIERLNLGRILTLRNMYLTPVIGFSDHQDGISMGPVAYALGARVFEKHMTHDHNAVGTDHRFSLEFVGMMQYVKALQDAYKGTQYDPQPYPEEAGPNRKMGQAVYLVRDLPAGSVISMDDITFKSPQDGLPAWAYESLINHKLARDVKKEEPLDWGDFEGEF